MKKILLVTLLVVSVTGTAFSEAKTANLFSAAQLEKLLKAEKIPAYIGDKGEFSWNSDLTAIIITGEGVNLRSQPNTKANIIAQLDKEMWGSIDYLGTWTHPDGSVWNIGLFDSWGNYPEDTPDEDKKVIFVSAKFSKAVDNKDYRANIEEHGIGGADAGFEDIEENVIDTFSEMVYQIRNVLRFPNYPASKGYAPIGKAIEERFSNPYCHWENILRQAGDYIKPAHLKYFEKDLPRYWFERNNVFTEVVFGRAVQNIPGTNIKAGNFVLICIRLTIQNRTDDIYRYDVSSTERHLQEFLYSLYR